MNERSGDWTSSVSAAVVENNGNHEQNYEGRPPSDPPAMTPTEFFLLGFGVAVVVKAVVTVTTTVPPLVVVLDEGGGCVVVSKARDVSPEAVMLGVTEGEDMEAWLFAVQRRDSVGTYAENSVLQRVNPSRSFGLTGGVENEQST